MKFISRLQISNKIFLTLVWVSLIVVFILTFYPMYYVLIYSLNEPLAQAPGLMWWPREFTTLAYRTILRSQLVHRAFMISVARSTIGPLGMLVVTMLIAYPLSIRILPGRRVLNWYFVLTMYISAGLIPSFLLMFNLGLLESFWVYILPGLVNVFGMIIIRTYMENLPDSLTESAEIDGAGLFRIFTQIVVPLCLPVMAAITLFSAVGQWNAYADALIFNTRSEHLFPLQFVLVRMVHGLRFDAAHADQMMQMLEQQVDGRPLMTPRTMRMAITIVTIIPITLIYPFLQRYFIKGLLIGSIKG